MLRNTVGVGGCQRFVLRMCPFNVIGITRGWVSFSRKMRNVPLEGHLNAFQLRPISENLQI